MANEFTFSGAIVYEDSEGTEVNDAVLPANLVKSITTKLLIHHKQNIGITEEAIDLGGLASLGYFLFLNRDLSNYIELRMATGASLDHLRLDGNGGFAMGKFGSDVSAPFAIANVATCQVEYWIWAI